MGVDLQLASRSASGAPAQIFLKRAQADLFNSDLATAQTLSIMAVDHIRTAAKDPAVIAAADAACRRFRGGPYYMGVDPVNEPEAIASSIWWYAKHQLKFVHHEDAIRELLGERDQLQLLVSPSLVVRMRAPEGDCAVYTMLVGALLQAKGIGFEIITAACDPNRPDEFSHVWARAVLADGSRIPLDASHGEYPGWQVPAAHTLKRQVWDESGRPIKDRAPRYNGLHEYRGGRRAFGLGDDSGDDGSSDGGAVYTSPTDTYSVISTPLDTPDCAWGPAVGGICPSAPTVTTPTAAMGICAAGYQVDAAGNCYNPSNPLNSLLGNYPAGSLTAPAQSDSAAWAAFATAATKAGLTLAEIGTIQPGTVVSANGQILRQATGFSLPTNISSLFGSASGSSSSLLLLLASAGLIVFLMARGK